MSTEVMHSVNAGSRSKVRTMAQVGMLSAIAVVLMLFEIRCRLLRRFMRLISAKFRCWLAVLLWDRQREWLLSF